jgi:FG-GAP-like repeat/PASTA domain/FG-GAP repeat
MGRGVEARPRRFCARPGVVLLACLGAALPPAVAGAAATSAPVLAPMQNYVTDSPASVAVGDLSGDGQPDLATASDVEDTVSVFLNKGRGRFRFSRDYGLGGAASPYSVVIGDLNGDGKRDLATANAGSDNVSVFLNQGDGTFRIRRAYATAEGPESIAIGDLNGDGKADLATEGDTTISVLLNKGDGSFPAHVDYPIGSGLSSVAIGDLNDDGKPDLAAVTSPADVSVLVNRGDGSFAGRSDYPTGKGPRSIAISDLTGDRKPDLATANQAEPTVSVLRNTGDGSFLAPRNYKVGGAPESLAIGDLNADQKPDLVIANLYNRVSVVVNNGNGNFGRRSTYRTESTPQAVAVADLNGDRNSDVVSANVGEEPATFSVLLNATGRCGVPRVRGTLLPAARRAIVHAGCRVGKIRRAYSTTVKTGRVISARPSPGSVLRKGGKINLVVSRGRKP